MRVAWFVALLTAACAAHPVSGFTTIPKDTATTCGSICADMGLALGAVVVVASQVGCVCERAPSPRAGAAAATVSAIVTAEKNVQDREQTWVPGF